MFCPNCGTNNESGVRFCANCGTALADTTAPPPPPPQYQQPIQPEVVSGFPMPSAPKGRNDFLRLAGMGCLIFVALVAFFGLSCMRSCLFGRRRYRYR